MAERARVGRKGPRNEQSAVPGIEEKPREMKERP